MARFCKHCGAQLSDNAKFCKGCGQAVAAPASNNTQTVYQTPIQNVQMSVNGVCPNCGSQMRPGAKFCRVCGMASLSNDFAGCNTQKKKRSKMLYPIVAAVTALAITIVSVGGYYLYDRVISPRIGNDGFTQSYEYRKFKDMSYPKGNSKAFSITPVDGVTISAKKDALKEDTDITFTPIEDERVYEEYTPVLESMGSTPLAAFDFDMGLEPEECIPGYVDMSFDLAALGVPENLWEDIDVYRQREEFDTNEPAGAFEKYAADLDKDGKLTMSTTQNCSIWLTLTAGFIKIKGLLAAAATMNLSGPVVAAAIIVVTTTAAGAVAWFKNDQQHGHFDKDSTIKIEIRDKWKYDIMVDLKDTELKDEYKNSSVKNNVAKLNEYSRKLREKAEKAYLQEVYKRADDGKKGILLFKFFQNKERVEQIKKTLNKEEYIKAYFEKDEKFNELAGKLQIPQSVQTTIAVINDAYDYIGAHNIKHKSRVVEFDICPPSKMNALGLKVSSRTWPSYMNLNIKALVQDNRYIESGVDEFRLTCTHEYFHICQEEYVWVTKVKESVEDTRLEEATAAVLERDASIYFYDKGIQKTNPDPAIGGASLGYVGRNEQYCYSLPLNELPDDVGSSGVKNKVKNTFVGRENDPWVDIGYTEADLIDFLRSKKGNVSIASIMNSYKNTIPHTSFVDILRSGEAFNISTDEEWNKLYHEFIKTQTKRIAETTPASSRVFPEYLDDYIRKIDNTGTVVEWKFTKDTISCVKWINPNAGNKKAYIVILECTPKNEDEVLLSFLKDDYTYNEEDRNYTDPVKGKVIILYSAGCIKDKKLPSTINAICIFEPDAPAFSLSGGNVSVTTMEAPEELKKKGKITALRTMITYKNRTVTDDTPVLSEDPDKQLGKGVTIDISELGSDIKGEDLSCKQAWIYVDKEKTEYIGPEVEGVFVDDNISGTWDLDVDILYDSQMLNKFVSGYMNAVDMYGQMYGQDSIADVTDIGKMYQDGKSNRSKAKMILKPTVRTDTYEAVFKYTTGAPDETYDGTYDARSKKLVLKPRKKTTTGSDGITYDYKEFGLQSDINIQIKRENDKNGNVKYTLTGESANDPNNPIVAYTVKLSGVRVSDNYE